jgi:hypothetical protein
MLDIFKNLKTPSTLSKLKSDYVSVSQSASGNKQLPNGYPCTYDNECTSPAVCQFNVCTSNYTVNEGPSLYESCKGMTPVECAKQMQKQRENEEVSVFVPITDTVSGGSGISYKTCKLDSDCSNSEFCMSNVCLDKKNFPLIARHKKMSRNLVKKEEKEQQHDDYYYF